MRVEGRDFKQFTFTLSCVFEESSVELNKQLNKLSFYVRKGSRKCSYFLQGLITQIKNLMRRVCKGKVPKKFIFLARINYTILNLVFLIDPLFGKRDPNYKFF